MMKPNKEVLGSNPAGCWAPFLSLLSFSHLSSVSLNRFLEEVKHHWFSEHTNWMLPKSCKYFSDRISKCNFFLNSKPQNVQNIFHDKASRCGECSFSCNFAIIFCCLGIRTQSTHYIPAWVGSCASSVSFSIMLTVDALIEDTAEWPALHIVHENPKEWP